jgi:hypothetical protein
MRGVLTLSRRTWSVGIAGLLAVAVVWTLIGLQVGGEAGVVATSDIGETLIVSASALLVFVTALSFRPGEAVRLQWFLIGLGLALFAVGDLTWSVIEVGMGQDVPYPGIPDIFYVVEYVFLFAGLVLAVYAYRNLVDLRWPLAIAAAVSVIATIVLYFGLIASILGDAEVALGEKALSAFYPLADVWFVFAPAFMAVLTVIKLGGGVLGWPWGAVSLGAIILAAGDSVYVWLEWQELYQSGQFVDITWMLGAVLIAVGAAIAWDLGHPKPVTT